MCFEICSLQSVLFTEDVALKIACVVERGVRIELDVKIIHHKDIREVDAVEHRIIVSRLNGSQCFQIYGDASVTRITRQVFNAETTVFDAF